MNVHTFIPFEPEWKELLSLIIPVSSLHGKWLNTLSFLENSGARKIAVCEHPTKVKEEMLKHAAEEFRHAHYLKSQIKKVIVDIPSDYSLSGMLGDYATLHYLHALDALTCGYLKKERRLSQTEIKEAAYILVTYAVELRASELYPVYHDLLKKFRSKVAVKSILLEEEEHLAEMERELHHISNGPEMLNVVCEIEGRLCRNLVQALSTSVRRTLKEHPIKI